MTHAVKISEELFSSAKLHAKVFHRSTAGQIEYWSKIGQLVEQNPDLPFTFIQDILMGIESLSEGSLEEFKFTQ
jgi:hypothetical protein